MKSTYLKGKGTHKSSVSHRLDARKSFDKDRDTHFSYNMTVLIGCSAEVTTRSGEKYEGVFVAYSSAQEVMLEAAHLVCSGNDESPISKHYDVLIIPSDKLMAMKFENATPSYATREFQTDAGITSGRGLIMGDKQLTPWDGGIDEESQDELDLGASSSRHNGWEAQEMFRKNEEKYGVVSSYNQDLAGYTTQLDKSDIETFKKHEEQALQVAEEIEKNLAVLDHSKLENNDDEEEAFSAVVRPRSNNNHVNTELPAATGNDKYIPPSRRLNPPQHQHAVGNSGGPSHFNNVGFARKQNYGFARNPVPNNISYSSDTRKNFDRRVPQYAPSLNHPDSNRQTRMGNKQSLMERRGVREDGGKSNELLEFHSKFQLAPSSDDSSSKGSIPKSENQKVPTKSQPISPSANLSANIQHARNESVPSIPQVENPKLGKDDTVPSSEHVRGGASVVSDKASSPQSTAVQNSGTTVDPDSLPKAVDERAAESPDSKSKPFTFNVFAKEFNPTSKGRTQESSPSPPKVTGAAAQIIAAPQVNPYVHALQLPQAGLLLTPYPQETVSNSSIPLNGTPPRHLIQHRKGNLIGGINARNEMSPSAGMPLPAGGPPLLAGSLHNTGTIHHPQYTFGIPHHAYAQPVRIHQPSIMPIYPSDGVGGTPQMHMPLHFIPNNGPTSSNSGAHQVNSATPANSIGQTYVFPFRNFS